MNPVHLQKDPERILFIRDDRLGETLLNLPAVAELRTAYRGARLTAMVSSDVAPLLTDCPDLDEVIAPPGGGHHPRWLSALGLSQLFRRKRFDLVVISNPKKECHLAAFLAGVPVRVGYNRKGGWLLTHRLQDRKALGERHEVEYNLDLVRALGLRSPTPQWHLPRYECEQREVLQLLEQQGIEPSQPFIVIHPWSSNPVKRWPADRYRALIRQIVDPLQFPVVLIGSPQERSDVLALLPADWPVANLVGRTTLRQLAALLRRARLLVSNDSGPVHLAAALNTQTLVLFGTSEPAAGPRRWGPWGTGHVVIWKPSMEAITAGEVFKALQQILLGKNLPEPA